MCESEIPHVYPRHLSSSILQDIIALIIQAVGGAKASLAVQNARDPGPVRALCLVIWKVADTANCDFQGGNIMLAGIAFQLGALVL